MPALSDYTAGTITLTNGSVNFTGSGTGWQAADFREGDTILGIEDNAGVEYVIATITGNGAGTLTQEWEGATGTYAYRMRYMADGARVTAQARNLIELLDNGNIQALAGLTGPGVPVFNGPHAMEIKPVTDFVNGVAYNVQVDTIADRAAYDGQSEGFAVLVSDVGDGRSALFSKASNTSGDWTDPAYVTGPVGPLPDVTVGTVTTGDPGTSVIVTPTPTVDGVELDFTIPAGRGPVVTGDYSGATAYVLDDAVLYNGSSWVALGPTTGNAPPVLPTTSNAYWQLLARQGIDGTGTVNTIVAGVGIAIDNTDPTSPVVSNLIFSAPQGRLSLTNGVSVPTSDVVAATTVYYVPATGSKVLVWNGAQFAPKDIGAGLTLPLSATYNGQFTIYDCFVIDDGGTLRLAVGTGYAPTRPVGSGSELELKSGIWTNKHAMTMRFGTAAEDTSAVAANRGTFVGSFVCEDAAGQVTDSAKKRHLSNAYNQAPRRLHLFGNGANHEYSTAAWRMFGGDPANMVQVLNCLGGAMVQLQGQADAINSTATERSAILGIGLDSATVEASGLQRNIGYCTTTRAADCHAFFSGYPGVGLHSFNMLQFGGGADTQTWRFFPAYGLSGSWWG